MNRPASPNPQTKTAAPPVVRRPNPGAPIAIMLAILAAGGWWIYTELQREAPKTAAKPKPAAQQIPATVQETPAPAPAPDTPQTAKANPTPTAPTDMPGAAETKPAPPAPEKEPAAVAHFAGEAPLALAGIDATKADAIARDKELLAKAVSAGAWDEYRGLLTASLSAVVERLPASKGRDRFAELWKHPAFYQAFLRWQVLELFPGSAIRSSEYAEPLLSWLLVNDAAMEETLLVVKPGDDTAKVIDLLSKAWYIDPTVGEKYFNLALACAVVFDRDVRIQHPVGEDRYAESKTIDGLGRYRWYVDKNEKGKLAAPVHRSSARDLVWVVCAPVSESELEWAVARVSLNRSKWGNAYGMIEYLMERAVKGLNPYKEYTFAEILKEGGICGDQSYFCVNTARANGIPGVILAGETDLGGHAWAALKVKRDEWNTHIGRIGGVSNGEGSHPQLGGRITEQEIWLWNDRSQQSPVATRNVFRHLWLARFLEKQDRLPLAEEAVVLANTLGPAFTETWQALHDVLAAKTRAAENPGARDILQAWAGFVADMRSEFRDNPRMAALAAKAESEYIFPHARETDARRALMRERRRIERNGSEQKDLIADSLKREAGLIRQNGAPDANDQIARLYSRALREHGSGITGFKRMSEDYYSFVRSDSEYSRKAVRDIELAFTRVVETGTKEWFRANTETSIYKMICAWYRETGETARAERLEKRYQRILKAAERGAL